MLYWLKKFVRSSDSRLIEISSESPLVTVPPVSVNDVPTRNGDTNVTVIVVNWILEASTTSSKLSVNCPCSGALNTKLTKIGPVVSASIADGERPFEIGTTMFPAVSIATVLSIVNSIPPSL